MNTNRQRLPNHLPAATALLGCILCVNQYHLTAGTCSLAYQDLREGIPSCIADTASQPVVLQHPFDVQALRSDDAVSVDQRTRNLVVEVATSVADLRVKGHHSRLNLLPPIAAVLAAGQRTLPAAKFWQDIFQRPTISQLVAVRRGDERFQANVDSNQASIGVRRWQWKFDRKNGKPLISNTTDDTLFQASACWQWPVPSHSNGANSFNTQLSVNNPPSIPGTPTGTQREGVESVWATKSRPSCPSARLHSAEEGAIRAVKASKRLLARTGDEKRPKWMASTNPCYPSALLRKGPVVACRLPTEQLSIKSRVVKSTVRFKGGGQQPLLISVHKQPVSVASKHLFLSGYVCVYGAPYQFSNTESSFPGRRFKGSNLLFC